MMPLHVADVRLTNAYSASRNIVTVDAEDGSGIGSAIVAAMTKARRDAGIYPTL